MNPTVTYSGEEAAIVAALIARGMAQLDDQDWEVADLMLDKALSALPRPLAPDVEALIAAARENPLEKWWTLVVTFDRICGGLNEGDFAIFTGKPLSEAMILLERLALRHPTLTRIGHGRWVIKEPTDAD